MKIRSKVSSSVCIALVLTLLGYQKRASRRERGWADAGQCPLVTGGLPSSPSCSVEHLGGGVCCMHPTGEGNGDPGWHVQKSSRPAGRCRGDDR